MKTVIRTGMQSYAFKIIKVTCLRCGQDFKYKTKVYARTGNPMKKRWICDHCHYKRILRINREWRKRNPGYNTRRTRSSRVGARPDYLFLKQVIENNPI